MRRRLIGIAAALALGVIPAVAVAPPALASTHVCTGFGNNWCLDANSLAAGTSITNGSGRDIILSPKFASSDGFEVYQLVFARDTTKCVGLSANGLAEVRDCSGGSSNFTNWDNSRQLTNLGYMTVWYNHSFESFNCPTNTLAAALTSDNHSGSRLFCSDGNQSGEFLQFVPSPSP